MSSDGLNLPTVYTPLPPDALHGKITEKIVMLTPFFTEGVLHI